VENDETRLLPQAQLNESLDSTSAVDVSNLDDGGHEPDTWEATEAGDAEWDQQLASRGHATDESASGEDLSHLFDISGEGQDGFIAAIPVFRERYLTIHVTEDELGEQVVFRYWDQDDEGEWQAEPETFQVPRSRLHDVMSALIAAGAGQSTTERPPWFNPDPEPGRREDSDDEP